MSLSFVSSAVQTGTESGGFEEKAIESKEVDAVNKRNQHQPLIDQLRANKEKEEARLEEEKRDRMRGTCALDDDDIAHLDAVAKQKQDKLDMLQQRTQSELAEFRAARLEKQQSTLDEEAAMYDELREREKEATTLRKPEPKQQPKSVVPKLIVKKKKKRRAPAAATDSSSPSSPSSSKQQQAAKKQNTGSSVSNTNNSNTSKPDVKSNNSALGSLLGDYGSSSDED
mmetsp:Transcript_513/g.1449  ORF Transcript_513/g.1449 Transcript_513/m.1449 type:complete len:227 (+) Transcript_513:172-852(+)